MTSSEWPRAFARCNLSQYIFRLLYMKEVLTHSVFHSHRKRGGARKEISSPRAASSGCGEYTSFVRLWQEGCPREDAQSFASNINRGCVRQVQAGARLEQCERQASATACPRKPGAGVRSPQRKCRATWGTSKLRQSFGFIHGTFNHREISMSR